MKKYITILLGLSFLTLSGINAQNRVRDTFYVYDKDESIPVLLFDNEQSDIKAMKKEIYKSYSKWTMGLDLSIPFFYGDMKSFAYDKDYIGGTAGLYVGYQITPSFGVMLSGSYGRSRVGSPSHARNYILGLDGMTYYPPTSIPGLPYSDIYSRISFWNAGLHFSINVNDIFTENKGKRLMTVLLEPAIYLQKFYPTVYTKSDNDRFTQNRLNNDLNLGLGGNINFRFRLGRGTDLQLYTGMIWINNNNFDGVKTMAKAKDSYMWNTGVRLTIKFNKSKHVDNLLYAPSINYLDRAILRAHNRANSMLLDDVHNENTRLLTELSEMPDTIYVKGGNISPAVIRLPRVYFSRGSSHLNQKLYKKELNSIVASIEDHPDSQVHIWGSCDHTGNSDQNMVLSRHRAQSVADYLISQGVDPSRIITFGIGEDDHTVDENRFLILARKAEVYLVNN